MMLVLNCGSQTIRWKLFKESFGLEKEGCLASKDYRQLKDTLELIKSYGQDISIIGHRVVHGGEKFKKPLIISRQNLKELEKLDELAPLHNHFNILGIRLAAKVFPKVKQVAVFDTEFFADIPEVAHTYALPEDIRNKYGIRKYGFHGISHEYAAKEGAKALGRPFEELKIITCHLGGGASIAAIHNGKAIDTSMGFTPMDGLVMMTRPGALDPGIMLRLRKIKNLGSILNQESGIKGICGFSEMLDVLQAVEKGDKKACLALNVFVYSIKKYIGAYYAVLGGCDLLVFTGAIGAGSVKIKDMICNDLRILNNIPTASPSRIHDADTVSIGTKILQIKTDEELAIAMKIS